MPATLQAIEEGSTRSDGDERHDSDLVLAARQDLAAFEPLYRRYADRVYRYCLRRLDEPDRAADATSAIFIKAMQSIDHCQPESFRSWLFSIAHNTTIDARRTTRARERAGLQPPERREEDSGRVHRGSGRRRGGAG